MLANGFFVATEFALVSVRRTRIEQLVAEGNSRARSALDALNHLDAYIAATQLGITMSSLALGWLGEPVVASLLEPLFLRIPFLPAEMREAASHTVAVAIAFAVITALHIVLGELAPKSLALQRAEATSLWVARPIHWFLAVFRPVILSLNAVGNAVVRLAGIQPAAGHALVQSAEELKLSVAASREAGLVDETAQELVGRAFTFTDLDADQVMVPRTEVVAVPVTISLEGLVQAAAQSGHTRLPVYDGDADHIVGVVNVKRLLPLLLERCKEAGDSAEPRFDVRAHVSEPLIVPGTVPAAQLMARLREARAQFAIVIDEYGGTAGIVTLEDLVESLVGEIQDELEPEEPEVVVGADGSLVLDGLTTLVEAEDRYGLRLRSEAVDVETIGGYVFSALGRVAVVGDEVVVPSGETIRVEDLDGLRVAQVRILPPNRRRAGDAAAET
ncbi:MAG: HlyC/CorC family transporter [Chloroflexi bacterium]|nr:HlyC/CorC family transporter [Chloroflexota bacterium]